MKKIILTLSFVISLVYTNFGQQNVSMGSTHEYNVTDTGLSYTWTATGGTPTDLSTQKGAKANIVWDTPGVYQLAVFATDANMCVSETQTINVRVMAEASITFANTSTDIITCSALNSGASGGLHDKSEFELTITSGLAPFKLKYKILKPDGSDYIAEKEITGLTGAGDLISIDNDFKNNSTVDVEYTVIITQLTTADGFDVPMGDAANVSRKIIIHAKPVISNIKIN